jgi:hypothetical protein
VDLVAVVMAELELLEALELLILVVEVVVVDITPQFLTLEQTEGLE